MEKMILSDDQKQWLWWMLKGMGLNASKKDFSKKETKEMEKLIEAGLAYCGKNCATAKTGMYYIPTEEMDRIRKVLNQYHPLNNKR